MRLALSQPITAHGEQVTALTFRDPRAGDLRSLPLGSRTVGDFVPVLAQLAAVPPSSIDQMAPADLFRALDWLYPFFVGSPPTGSSSPPSAPGATAGAQTSSGGSPSATSSGGTTSW